MGERSYGSISLVVAVITALAGCGDGGTEPGDATPPSVPQLSVVARQYLNAALDTMETHSVRRLEIDWQSLRADALEEADGAVRVSDTYPAIEAAIERIGDGHSRFIPPPGAGSSLTTPGAVRSVHAFGPDGARGLRLGSAVGYVSVPAFNETNSEAMTRLATDLQSAIQSADGSGTCGWIVDLRGNAGGNMFPMLAGVGPVLGEGDAGSLVDPEGPREHFFYEAGGAGLRGADGSDERVIATVDGTPYEPIEEPAAITVLTSVGTRSSGEAVAVAFRGHPDAVSVGQATAGVSTGVEQFRLLDGAILALATSTMADRTGELYGDELRPEIAVEVAESGDPTLERAYQLVAGATGCSAPSELPLAPEVDLTGEWSGIGNRGAGLTIDLELVSEAEGVTGEATIALGSLDQVCEIDGVRDGGELGLRLECPAGTLRFAGVVLGEDSLTGILTGGLLDIAFGFSRS